MITVMLSFTNLCRVCVCSTTEELNSAGFVKDSSCRTWIGFWTGRTSTACCWAVLVRSCSARGWAPKSRIRRFS